jgi:aldehyde dehydrogenase (NAD+)
MESMDTSLLVARQRAYFGIGATRSLEFRMEALRKLRSALMSNEQMLLDALRSDLNKSPAEAYMSEFGMVLEEIRFHLRHLPQWVRNKTVPSALSQFCGRSLIVPEPYGVALIMSPWNYPVLLCLLPLIGAISAGNCAIVKPSAYTPAASAALAKLLRETFDSNYIAVVEGGREQNRALLDEQFDYIFFTGSVTVGKAVMTAAAKHLTPVTLELGGKSPVIIDETANLKLAARRVAFGKVLNAGQTCVGPDYLLIHHSVKDRFIEAFRTALAEFFPNGDYSDMPVIVNDKHFQRLTGLLEGQNVVVGGGADAARRFIEPSLLDDVSPDAPIMQEEIFGPILPVMTYQVLDEAIGFIKARPKPLALYLFTSNRASEKKVLDSCSFGGGCINDTITHLASSRMPFGGVGESGMGSYHGKQSFDTFTHHRSVLKKAAWPDPSARYQPYDMKKLKLLRYVIR